MLLYLYDIKVDLKDYSKVKRRFYYHLKKSRLCKLPLKTKSVILVPDELEDEADAFFNRFKEYLEVYKAKVIDLEEL
ncbi:hypothetical protein J7K41_01845 [Candidatus Micrarchaeota archaeon]|nr:hypothetical protein [Candidatus Micrarchaeota archaeon]